MIGNRIFKHLNKSTLEISTKETREHVFPMKDVCEDAPSIEENSIEGSVEETELYELDESYDASDNIVETVTNNIEEKRVLLSGTEGATLQSTVERDYQHECLEANACLFDPTEAPRRSRRLNNQDPIDPFADAMTEEEAAE